MDNTTIKLLSNLIQQNGNSAISDQRLIEALIRENLQDYRLESFCLIAAIRERIPQDLLKEKETGFDQRVSSLLVKRLIENQGIADENAQWAVEAWAVALGLIEANDEGLLSNQEEAAAALKWNPNVEIDVKRLYVRIDEHLLLPFCYVPAGDFKMGSNLAEDYNAQSDEMPQHQVYVKQFWIGKYPITTAQFSAFVRDTGYETTAETMGSGKFFMGFWIDMQGANWRHPRGAHSSLEGKENHPVTQISWFDAMVFCKWLRSKTGLNISLPFEHEWEKAARGVDARLYPWGNQPAEQSRCNYDLAIDDTTSVEQYSPASDSPYGVANMAGSVWEWTRSIAGSYPYQPDDGRENPRGNSARVQRGGSFYTNGVSVRCAFRGWSEPAHHCYGSGFRLSLYS